MKVIIPKISDHLVHIFNNSLSIRYYHLHFKESIIIILRKQEGVRDHTNLKSYWPISLLNTYGKMIEVVLATRINF